MVPSSNFPGGPRGYGYGVSNNTHAFVGFGKYKINILLIGGAMTLENDNWVELTPFLDRKKPSCHDITGQ